MDAFAAFCSASWSPKSSSRAIIPTLTALLSVPLLYIAFIAISESAIPNPDTYQPTPSMPFNLTNALSHIEHLAQNRRFVSTNALDQAMHYIIAELNPLASVAQTNHLQMEIQLFRSGPGSFYTTVGPMGCFHAYDNLISVVVRLQPSHLANHSMLPALLVNAHVDSAMGSPGVSDNLAAVGLTMDVIRAIVSLPPNHLSLSRPIIFLFNGAEETILPGAHSFISQHPWAKSIAAHINLESIGSGNLYYLFQLGPNAPWLARAYGHAVSIPYGTIAATDVFNTKVRIDFTFPLHVLFLILLSLFICTNFHYIYIFINVSSLFQQPPTMQSLVNLVEFLVTISHCMIMALYTTLGTMILITWIEKGCCMEVSLSMSWFYSLLEKQTPLALI